MRRRCLLPALVALLATATVGAPAQAAPAEPTRVEALVQTPHGVEIRRAVLPDRASAQAQVRRWRQERAVISADLTVPVRAAASWPADPLQADQWGLAMVRAPQAWAEGDATGQVVAVLDTGVDLDHPDLAGRLVPGYDLVDEDTVPQESTSPGPLRGHGTHVAGIVAATPGNGTGGAGAAPGAKVLPVRVLDEHGEGDSAGLAWGIRFAVDRGATVVNLSLGGPQSNATIEEAVQHALDAGVVVVAAMGNEGTTAVNYPAALPGVIAVAAVDRSGARAGYSNTGAHAAVAAPGGRLGTTAGEGIVSTWPGGGYAEMVGTSMATPFVSAAAAVLLAADGGLRPADVNAAVAGTARDLAPEGHDACTGAGLLDMAAARALVADDQPAVLPERSAVTCPEPPAVRDLDLACPADRLPETTFVDVGGTHARGVACVVWWGVADGTSRSTFSPGNGVTRGQMAKFVAEAVTRGGVELPLPATSPFSDVAGSTFQPWIDRLGEAGIVQGSGGLYRPHETVSRAQLATFLVRAAELVAGRALPAASSVPWDVTDGPHRDNIAKAVQAGFTAGTADGSYQPSAAVSRGQMASFVARLLDAFVAWELAAPPA